MIHTAGAIIPSVRASHTWRDPHRLAPFHEQILSGRARCPHRAAAGWDSPPSHRIRKFLLAVVLSLLLLGLLLGSAGCASRQNRRPLFSSQVAVNELVLLAMPIALNLDRKPDLDGFAVKIYAVNRKHPKSQPLYTGTLQILMFDGILISIATNTPRHIWTYSQSDLLRYRFESVVGTGYAFSPLWGTNFPAQDKITVAARYLPSEGKPILSAPSVITVVSK